MSVYVTKVTLGCMTIIFLVTHPIALSTFLKVIFLDSPCLSCTRAGITWSLHWCSSIRKLDNFVCVHFLIRELEQFFFHSSGCLTSQIGYSKPDIVVHWGPLRCWQPGPASLPQRKWPQVLIFFWVLSTTCSCLWSLGNLTAIMSWMSLTTSSLWIHSPVLGTNCYRLWNGSPLCKRGLGCPDLIQLLNFVRKL